MSRKQRKAKSPRSQNNVYAIHNDQQEPTPKWQPEPPLKPLNKKQAEYIRCIHSAPYTFATGYAGTSKTYIPTRIAARMLDDKLIDRIIVARPPASASESLGFSKGSDLEKMMTWIMPVYDALKDEISPSAIEYHMRVGNIEPVPLEKIKGRSFKNCFVIIDEAEDLTPKEFKAIITRLGQNSTMVFAGDIGQTDVNHSGMIEFIEMAKSNERLSRLISHIDFNSHDDIVRSEAVKQMIIGLDEIGL